MAKLATTIKITEGVQSASISEKYLYIEALHIDLEDEIALLERITELESVIEAVKKYLTDKL